MLVLSRRLGEKVVLPTLGVTITVVAVKPGVVRLGIEAPADVPVLREELLGRGTAPDRGKGAAAPQPCLA
jgi:carbon storage regulator CsrA